MQQQQALRLDVQARGIWKKIVRRKIKDTVVSVYNWRNKSDKKNWDHVSKIDTDEELNNLKPVPVKTVPVGSSTFLRCLITPFLTFL